MQYSALLVLSYLTAVVSAGQFDLSDADAKQQKCNGMYSKGAWGGSVDPYIRASFDNSSLKTDEDSIVSVIIFEWRDEYLIGVPIPGAQQGEKEAFCYGDTIKAGLCNMTQIGQFLLHPNASTLAKTEIVSQAYHLKNPQTINYPVKKTGYYCIWTNGFNKEPYQGTVEFRNAFGELPAAQIPKLAFYGGLTIVYAVVGAFWAFLYVQNRHDILPVQNYITAIIAFLVVEQLITWGFYDYQNQHGNNFGNKVLMVVTAVLNAGRNSFSFFLLLIVCMGYGVVRPSLGSTMTYVRILALTHFVFGVIYSLASLSVTPDSAGPIVLLVILPLSASLTAFYIWTLNSLNLTLKGLLERKQSIKALMYKRLWWCILGSILVIFVFFFFNSFTFASRNEPDFVPNHWKTRWFVLDGWLNLVYLFDICFVAYLWRPTANNRRFAMSDELAQDDDGGFEIASFRGSLDDDEEAGSPVVKGRTSESSATAGGQLSPVPPQPMLDGHDRRSLDEGETIFAVGDDGDRSDESDDGDAGHREERTRLNR